MSVLDKLYIRGIRSFGPNYDEKVKFSTPLTLFLGQNGCGKTTIIESLKFALTGESPAGTEGGRGFVNDPKLSNKSTTKAYVKLRFKDCKGDFVTVGRFIEVSTQAGGKLRFKSLNPSIRREDAQGEVEDISGRCFDIDVYCAQKLNVSKAIINNVIFCHQENSAWPLEEAKKLKEKFDEIFGATEYNKCVERFRKLIKEKRVNIKVLKEQWEQKSIAKKNTERLKESLSGKEEQLRTIQSEIERKEREMEPLQQRLNEINELVDTISTLHQKLTGLEKTLEGIRENQIALKKHLDKEYEGTDEELDNEILNFGDFQENIKKQISEMEEKGRQVESTIVEVTKQRDKFQIAFGQLKEEENQHLKRGEELNDLIQKAKTTMKVATDVMEPVPDMLQTFKIAIKNDENNFNQTKKDVDNKEKQLQEVIDAVRDKFAAAKENLSSATKTAIDINLKKQEAELKLSSLAFSNSQIESLGIKIKETEEMLQKKKADFNENKEHQELEEMDAQIEQKEQLQSKLDREYKTLHQNYVTEQSIDKEKNSIGEMKGEICSLKQKHQQHFETLFGDNLPLEKIEDAVKAIQKREDQKVKNITKNISDCEKKVTSLESSVKHTKEKLQSHTEELAQNKSKIESVCKGKNFTDVLKQSYIKKEKLQKDKGTYRSAKTLFEEFINQFEVEKPCCPVCETDFSGKQSMVSSIIKKLKSRIQELPQKLTLTENELKKEEDFYNKLQQLKSVSDNVEILQDAKIPLLEEELHQTSEKLDETKMELVSLKNDLTEPQNLVETCRKIIADVALLDRLNLAIKKSEASVENMKKELNYTSSNRTMDETESELARLKADLSNLRRQYKTKRDLFAETQRSIQRLYARMQHEIQRKIELNKLVQEQPLLEKQIEDYESTMVQLEEEKGSLNETIAALEKELREAERNRNDATKRNERVLEEKRLELDARRRIIDDVQKLHATVERYEQSASKTKLENVLKSLDEAKKKLSDMENAKKILSGTIMEKKEELASQESKLRSLKDNKELRASKQKSKDLEIQVNILRTKIGQHNSRSICEERQKVIEKIDMKQREKNVKTGEQNTIQQTIKEHQKELSKKEHKEVLTEYKKKYYELRVEQLAAEDLDTYTQALEKSILKFHKERMVQINMTIRELWRTIYKGNDIDYIEIQTVDDIGGGGNKRRSYNYKVVQVKKGVELEMRGRCSAGQRVLACLVIRMALAETFSANCGILALDEPTTNLDRDNIMSLSDALSKIITAREKQKSFQLLIITHDEEFLQTLTRDQSVSHYFRVQRNADGFSEIKKEVL